VRFAVAKKIVERAADFGIKANDIVIDPLVMPLGATPADAVLTYSQQAFEIVAKIRKELGANTTCGLSNVSFGLPNRHWMNGIFVAMAAGYGMTSAIMNPLHEEEMTSVRAADALLGHDQSCMKWMAKYRAPAPEGAEGAGRGRRGGGRRRSA
jgi:5-methyltetrahydrofolate--homocysteine methyltransferase